MIKRDTPILIVEDDAAIRFALRDFLEAGGFTVLEGESVRTAIQTISATPPSVVLSDYKLPDGTAIDLLQHVRALQPSLPFVILTGHGTVELAVQAIQAGADDFMTKPVALPALELVIRRVLDRQRDARKKLVRDARQQRAIIDPFMGQSVAIQKLREHAHRVAESDRPVLVLGETGSGKGVLTRWIHTNGARADEPFVDLNCASLPRELLESELFGYERGAFTGAVANKVGLLELAHRGTFFLDEIGDLELALQPKLLKVLEDRTFRRVGAVADRQIDVRLIAATHQDLAGLVSEQRFRADLYFRISTIPLAVPPLRERVEDIPVIASRLLELLMRELGRVDLELSPDLMAALVAHHWPGNIRELRNVLERAVLLSPGGRLTRSDLVFDRAALPGQVSAPRPSTPDDDLTLHELQQRHIIRMLERCGGRVEEAAQRLGVPRSTLYQKLKTFRVNPGRPSPGSSGPHDPRGSS